MAILLLIIYLLGVPVAHYCYEREAREVLGEGDQDWFELSLTIFISLFSWLLVLVLFEQWHERKHSR